MQKALNRRNRAARKTITGQNDHAKVILSLPNPVREDVVRGRKGLHQEAKKNVFTWVVENGAAANYRRLGKRLAAYSDMYRHGDGLVQVFAGGKTRLICKGSQLAPVIVDRIKMVVCKAGRVVSELPTANHLNALLRSEQFLKNFRPVDEVTTHPLYRDDFSLAGPGYNDCGPGQRILYLGPEPTIADSTEIIDRFLGVMDFATTADRTNTVAAALTVLLHHHWPGQKPAILVTSTRSHSGKGTITDFLRGSVPTVNLLYEANDWPPARKFD